MSTHPPAPPKAITAPECLAAKAAGRKLVVVTAYDFPTAQLLDASGVDILLVGDSLGMVVQGHPHSLTVTLDEMIYHTKMVSRAATRSMVVTDLPFMTYQVSPQQALENAGRVIQQGGAQAVKLEGGVRSAGAIAAITDADIPVMGHIGLTPQSLHRMGGFKVQRAEDRLLEDAQAVVDAGAFALVVEGVPTELGAKITASIPIPTIGIGAGAGCDGQVLVFHDLFNYGLGRRPRFVKSYGQLNQLIQQGAVSFVDEVRTGKFPGPEHGYQ
ncbi:MAG: 3-methyl-2-oxobutanoate hydroxymethyltransferase [Gemmatales bacterium]